MQTSAASSAAGKAYLEALRAARPGETPALPDRPLETDPAPDFQETLASTVREMVQTVQTGETTSQDFVAGRADPHSVVEALAEAEMALNLAVNVRNRVVEAYQEILRMPI
ncbi:MAG: flagellar hook-basal body complex protein FliE [Pseudomonadota bacterium]